MERENRYIVIKRSDLKATLASNRISKTDMADLIELAERVKTQRFVDSKAELETVVVERDWPEYERVWKMIEARVNMENQHEAIDLNGGVMLLASRICQACIQDAHEEGYDIEAGMFGPHLSKEMVEINNWRKKAELFDRLRELMGHIQDGSDKVVKLSQDDATQNYHVSVGSGTSFDYGFSLEQAILRAIESNRPRTSEGR